MSIQGKKSIRNIALFFGMLAVLSSKSVEKEISNFSLASVGEAHLAGGRYLSAVQTLLGTLQFARYIKDNGLIYILYTRLGDAYWNLGQMDLSVNNYQKAAATSRFFDFISVNPNAEEALKIHGFYAKAKEFRDAKQYQASIGLFEQAILSARSRGWINHELKCLRQKSIALYEMNDYYGFFLCNLEAGQLAQQANNTREICLCNNNLGIYYYKNQNYDKALDNYYYVYDLAQRDNIEDLKIDTISYLSSVFIDIGKYESAIICLKHIINYNKKVNNYNSLIGNLNNLAVIFRKYGLKTGDLSYFHEALVLYYEALFIAWEKNNEHDEYILISNISNVLRLLNKNSDSLRFFYSVIRKAIKYKDYQMYCDVQNNLGNMYFSEKMYSIAEICFNNTIKTASMYGYKKEMQEAYFGIAKIYEENFNYVKAAEYFKKSITLIENISSDINSDILKVKYFEENKNVYDCYIKTLRIMDERISSNNNDEICNLIETQKAKSLSTYMRNKSIVIDEERIKTIRNESERINKRMDIIQNTIPYAHVNSVKRNQLESELIIDENYSNRLAWKNNEIKEIEMGLEKGIIILNDMISAILNDNTAIIEYHLGDFESYLIFYTKKEKSIIILPPKKKIEIIVNGYIELICSNTKSRIDIASDSKFLYKEIMPSHKVFDLMNINNIVIIPDGILNYLPFETLMVRENSTDKYILEKYNISYSPSITVLYYLKNKKSSIKKKYLGIGDPKINIISEIIQYIQIMDFSQ
jgi:tetratricopeptide (TPR) repeat protein